MFLVNLSQGQCNSWNLKGIIPQRHYVPEKGNPVELAS
jgi:hypothetical protein